jgi:hypothetical protein
MSNQSALSGPVLFKKKKKKKLLCKLSEKQQSMGLRAHKNTRSRHTAISPSLDLSSVNIDENYNH